MVVRFVVRSLFATVALVLSAAPARPVLAQGSGAQPQPFENLKVFPKDIPRDTLLATRLVDIKVCSINDTYSGLKFVRRRKDR